MVGIFYFISHRISAVHARVLKKYVVTFPNVPLRTNIFLFTSINTM